MRKTTCTVVLAVMAAASLASEQPASDHPWYPSPQQVESDASEDTGAWVSQSWRSNQPWSADEEEKAAWKPQDTPAIGLAFTPESNLDEVDAAGLDVMLSLAQQQESPWLAKRQPPRRLGSLVDLYRSVARGLSPFVPNSKNQVLSASPERRSGRRPAACRFGPFGLVCWNAASRGAVMRQRSSQYGQ
ncbi:uncharacterized protein [Panulirus ornatus]|uniref:uncharacterized protein n=1 Tax=Panulirus ornatus TaxID=150431 RepID=UPI003A8963C3